MVKTVRRRAADPSIVLQLWEAITCIRQGRQVANLDRIFRFFERSYGINSKDCQRHINLAVKENLLVKELSKSRKGGQVGKTQDGFWCAEERTEESEEPHDWYCFECHMGGDVLCCGTCHRVYHPDCVKVEDPEKIFGLWICPICESCRKKSMQISKWDLNKILLHVTNRMKEKARDLTKKLNLDELPNYYNLVYQHMDLSVISQKLHDKKYRTMEEFQGDAQALIHVAAVYHGLESEKAKLSEEVYKDCMHDITEIRLCKDCYIMSNDRTQKDWFCKPCHPPHELVWAQMTGFGYWPAKVLQKNEDKIDVRFFGNRHERAWIDTIHVRDINTDRKQLKLKQSAGWRKAVSEMEKYQKNLASSASEDGLSKSTSLTTAMRRKMKRKAPKNEEDGEEDGDEEEGEEEEEEEDEDAKGEARHVVRSSSTTDAGQDQSVSTSQISPESSDEPPIKKIKAAPPTPSFPKATEEEADMETAGGDTQDTPPPPALEEEQQEPASEDLKEEVEEEFEQELDEEVNEEEEKEEKEDDKKKEDKKKSASKSKAAKPNLEADYKKKLDKAVKDALDKARQEWQSEKEKLAKEARDKLAAEVEKTKAETEERCKKEYTDQIQKLKDEISQTKKKQWCISCEKEAMYHCCWNTSYCSINCQQVHWHQEHKRLCRRKR